MIEQQMRPKRSNKRLTAVIALLAVALVAAAAVVCSVSISMYNNGKVLSGVTVGGIDVGGLTRDAANQKLEEYVTRPENSALMFQISGESYSLPLQEIEVAYDVAASADAAYAFGRGGLKIFTLFSSMGEKDLPITFTYNADKFQTILAGWMDAEGSISPTYVIDDDVMTITNGVTQFTVQPKVAAAALEEAIGAGLFDAIVLEKEYVTPTPVDINVIYDEVCGQPIDATYKIVDGAVEFIPEKDGIDFDKTAAMELVGQHHVEGQSFEIPLKITPAEVTQEDLEATLFADTLGEYSTGYSTSTSNRAHNVELASDHINGTVLAPGQTFSYNDVVGPRTMEAGFKLAGAYLNGKVVDDVGGGICQVSSTLYNAALYADLKISQRVNHQLTVSYAPLGRDATVAYGSIDFTFVNNRETPVKIVAECKNRKLFVRILGQETENPVTVELVTSNMQVIPYQTEEKENPDAEPGSRTVIQAGENGYTIDLYRVRRQNGEVISNALEAKSKYMSTTEIVELGPPAPSPSPSPEITPEATPEVTPEVTPEIAPEATPAENLAVEQLL